MLIAVYCDDIVVLREEWGNDQKRMFVPNTPHLTNEHFAVVNDHSHVPDRRNLVETLL